MFMKCPHCGNELKDDAKCLTSAVQALAETIQPRQP